MILSLFSINFPAPAQDLGTYGATWPIAEANLLTVIQQQLYERQQDGRLEAHQAQIQSQFLQRIQRPVTVNPLNTTQTPRTFYFDPAIVLPTDLKDHRGEVFHSAGTTFNPLSMRPLTQTLLFIHGEDERQVQWALAEPKPTKIILIQGAPFELMKGTPDHPFYFDQQGHLNQKLGIQQVPARVTQVGLQLQIEELSCENRLKKLVKEVNPCGK